MTNSNLGKYSELRDRWGQEKGRFLTAMIATFVWGLAAHGYAFLNLTLSHDSMNEFALLGPISYVDGSVMEWKLGLGRVVEPFYLQIFRGPNVVPWWVGLLSLLWVALSSWLIARIFDLKNKLAIVLVSGFLCVNLTFTAMTATYITDLDANMFAVLMATCAAWLWSRGGWKAWLGIPCLVITLGIYQCMLSVTVVLVMFVCIERMLRQEKTGKVFLQGLKSIGIMLVAGGVYLGLVFVVNKAYGVTLRKGYNGLSSLWSSSSRSFKEVLWDRTYGTWVKNTFEAPTMMDKDFLKWLHILIVAAIAAILLFALIRRGISLWSKLLTVVLILLLPLGMNLACFLDHGTVHQLMMYSFWLLYLLLIVLLRWLKDTLPEKERLTLVARTMMVAAMAMLLLGSVKTANAVYVKKELERRGTEFTMTQVISRVEATEGYKQGKTKVAFIGTPRITLDKSFNPLYSITGCGYHCPISAECYYPNYVNYILNYPMNVVLNAESEALKNKDSVKKMPAYPAEGCIQWVGNVLVVKVR